MNNFEVEKYAVGEKFGREIDEGCLFEINDNLCSMTILNLKKIFMKCQK